MSNTACLNGPPFSIAGNTHVPGQAFAFSFVIDDEEAQEDVKWYEWYLDGTLVADQKNASLAASLQQGNYTIGGRLLTAAGWSGIKELDFQTVAVPVHLDITGPGSVEEGGSSATYQVNGTFADGGIEDVSASCTLSSTEGTFSGAVLSVPENDTLSHSRPATITATYPGGPSADKPITIIDTDYASGVLVVDIFNNAGLNAIGVIDSPGSHVAAYTGANIIPSTAAPANALLLASDFISQPVLNWRFEFNIAKLVSDNPGTATFTFYIKGRSDTATTLSGAYITKKNNATMTMSGSPGTYLPSVSGANQMSASQAFSTAVAAGADGDYTESSLTTLLELVYNTADGTITRLA